MSRPVARLREDGGASSAAHFRADPRRNSNLRGGASILYGAPRQFFSRRNFRFPHRSVTKGAFHLNTRVLPPDEAALKEYIEKKKGKSSEKNSGRVKFFL